MGGVHDDLAGLGDARGGVAVTAQDGDLNLAPDDPRLYEHLGIHRAGGLDSGGQVIAAFDLGDAQRRTGARGFDEQRVVERLAFAQHGIAVPTPPVGADDDVRGCGDAGGVQKHLGDLLVHARGAGEDAAAHVADAQHLEHPLDGAVLAVGAVQQRQNDVDIAQNVRAGGSQSGQRPASESYGELAAAQAVGGDPDRGPGVVQGQGGGRRGPTDRSA